MLTTKTGALFLHPRVLYSVIPAKAGIQSFDAIDSRLRGNDVVVRGGNDVVVRGGNDVVVRGGNNVAGDRLCRANQRAALAGWMPEELGGFQQRFDQFFAGFEPEIGGPLAIILSLCDIAVAHGDGDHAGGAGCLHVA